MNSREDVCYVTNLLTNKSFSHLVNWTYHAPEVIDINFQTELVFKKLPWILVLFDLACLLLVKKFKCSVFGVSWETNILTRSNFGYFQYVTNSLPTLLLSEIKEFINDDIPLMHVRLGDSPTLVDDLNSQFKLVSNLGYQQIRVVTNRPVDFRRLSRRVGIHFDIVGGTVLEDYSLLSSARVVIIPQSTFSWFAVLTNKRVEEVYLRKETLGKIDRSLIKFTFHTY